MSRAWKSIAMVGGLLLALPGALLALNSLCLVPLLALSASSGGVVYAVVSLALTALTLGAGLSVTLQADAALRGKPSKALRFPPAIVGPALFSALVVAGLVLTRNDALAGLFFPPIFLVLAALPPLWAVAWFTPSTGSSDFSRSATLAPDQSAAEAATTNPAPRSSDFSRSTIPAPDQSAAEAATTNPAQRSSDFSRSTIPAPDQSAAEAVTTNPAPRSSDFSRSTTPANGLTWRRGLVAFCGGATVSVGLAILLEILLPFVILILVFSAADTITAGLNRLFQDLAGPDVAGALANPAFIYIFIQVAVIAPLVEELVKPLVTLPLLRNLNRQETFWVGAMAGAGFAALENVIYATGGFSIWAGIFIVRALGGALHPLGSGLVSLGWRALLRREPHAFSTWLKQYTLAVLAHAAWNGGSLLVITLAGAQFFGKLPPEMDILGISMAGTTLAFLLLLGLAGLWIGRSYGHDRPLLAVLEADSAEAAFAPSDRAMALWGLACLLALVPLGITGLRLWLR